MATTAALCPDGASQVGSVGMRWAGSYALLCILLFVAVMIRRAALVRVFFMPASLIAGILGLFLVQMLRVFGDSDYANDPCKTSYKIFAADFIAGWSALPGIMINIVFATIFLGRKIPGIHEAWRIGGPQLMYGQIRAWGSWFWCILVNIAVLIPIWNVEPIVGGMFSIGFEGGHGTAAGLHELLGDDFYAMAITSATIGIILGCVGGTALVNWGVNRKLLFWQQHPSGIEIGKIESMVEPEYQKQDRTWNPDESEPSDRIDHLATTFRQIEPSSQFYGDRTALGLEGEENAKSCISLFTSPAAPKLTFREKLRHFPVDLYDVDARPTAGVQTIRSEAIDSFAFQLVHVGIAVAIGYTILRLLGLLDHINDTMRDLALFSNFPLFPMCMIGGIILELIYQGLGFKSPICGVQMNLISGTSVEFLVASAVATIELRASSAQMYSFIIVLIVGIVWQMFLFFFVAKRMFNDVWFERAIVEYGQSFGTTSIGLLLLRMCDPTRSTVAWEAFSYKQMCHEPVMGGGIWTTFAVMFLTKFDAGSYIVLGISAGAILLWLVVFFSTKKWFANEYAKAGTKKVQIPARSVSSSSVYSSVGAPLVAVKEVK